MKLILILNYPDFTREQESAITPVIGDLIVEQSGSFIVLARRISFELRDGPQTHGMYGWEPTMVEVTVVELDLGRNR